MPLLFRLGAGPGISGTSGSPVGEDWDLWGPYGGARDVRVWVESDGAVNVDVSVWSAEDGIEADAGTIELETAGSDVLDVEGPVEWLRILIWTADENDHPHVRIDVTGGPPAG